MREADDAAFPRYALYVTLGRAMCAHPPPKAEQLQVLNDVWTEIAKLTKTKDYVLVAMQYLRFLLLEFRRAHPLPPTIPLTSYYTPYLVLTPLTWVCKMLPLRTPLPHPHPLFNSHVEVSKMLRDILRRVTPDKAYLDLAPQMQRIASSLLELTTDLAQLFQMAQQHAH